MAKSKSLPWKTAPKPFSLVLVGNEEYGTIELPKKGNLTVNEAQFIREQTKGFPDVQQKAVELAYEISAKEGITKVEAFEALTSGVTSVSFVVAKPAKEGQDFILTSVYKDVPKGSVVKLNDAEIGVTFKGSVAGEDRLFVDPLPCSIPDGAFLAVEITKETAQNYVLELMKFQQETTELKPIRDAVYATAMLRRIQGQDWTLEETQECPIPLVADLAEFCLKEMNGWVEEETEGTADQPTLTEDDLKND